MNNIIEAICVLNNKEENINGVVIFRENKEKKCVDTIWEDCLYIPPLLYTILRLHPAYLCVCNLHFDFVCIAIYISLS